MQDNTNSIKLLRKKVNMSQAQFSRYLNIPISTIRNWEQGQRTPPDYVISLIEEVLQYRKVI